MSTIAIVGAGPGLGLAIARVFGEQGFSVALISRTQSRLDELAETLGDEGIEARGFASDVMDRDSLAAALASAKESFGSIDVLEFSPAPHSPVPGLEMVGALDLTVDSMAPQLEFYLYSAIAAVREVLPEMLERRSGTLLFTTGGGSISPIPMMGNINAASAALRNWAVNLNGALAGSGVHAAYVAINLLIDSGPEEASAAAIAPLYWTAYEARDTAEYLYALDSD
ncbi:SDR family oxidoreductase [Aeromicrobium sp. Root472D3]|uniref:SDR family NAD(P)-dependent oxidoreductase n=1 Tax=Aeromicrobium sp. Root472D3 TaxID=1736540 RepID=UPI0006F2D5DD|nr:SDR family NAD(P)-dependent oxidoreductase [Aeromicrobium sp. Root472D3]KQX75067.1 short-chain dehydrogenase [Aeromicrobium sp. Root472D3]